LVVATAELGFEAAVTDEISTLVTLWYEEDDTDLEVDVASALYVRDGNNFSFPLGQDYLTFGAYETALANDPLALDIGESRETTFIVNYESGSVSGTSSVFNGDQDKND
jgi:hypothetical protein